MITTKSQLSEAIKSGQSRIDVGGELAQKIIRSKKRKKMARIGSATLLVGSLAAIPFTGGASAVGAAAAIGLTAGPLSISTTELMILCSPRLRIKDCRMVIM
jgi:hypothetical protein